MKYLYLLFSILSKITFLSIFIFLLILQLEVIGIICIICLPFLFVIKTILFSLYTNKYPLNDILEFREFNITNKEIDKEIIIDFIKSNYKWETYSLDNKVILNLKGYLYQKAYIISYVTRQLRYSYINNEKSILKLFKLRLYLPKFKNCNVYIRFNIDNKTIVKQIIKNGICKTSILCQLINQSKYYFKYLSMRSVMDLKKTRLKIDEKRFQNSEY